MVAPVASNKIVEILPHFQSRPLPDLPPPLALPHIGYFLFSLHSAPKATGDISDAGQRNVQLPVTEDWKAKVQADSTQRLALRFIDCHRKAQSYRKHCLRVRINGNSPSMLVKGMRGIE